MSRYIYTVFAQAYGEGAYNECDYNCETGAGAGTSSPNPPSPLADTGIMVVGIVTIACLIIFVALLTRAMSRRSKQSHQEPTAAQRSGQANVLSD
jgi:hypothetical protein